MKSWRKAVWIEGKICNRQTRFSRLVKIGIEPNTKLTAYLIQDHNGGEALTANGSFLSATVNKNINN